MISLQDLLKVEIRCGAVVRADDSRRRTSPHRLWIDLGRNQNWDPKEIANFFLSMLFLGIPNENGDVVLLEPERAVPNDTRVI